MTTWNGSDLLRVSLSNGNLTFTGTSNQGGVRSTDSKTSGKWYYEAIINTNVASDTGVGIANGSVAFTALASNAGGGVIAFTDFSSGAILVNGSASGKTLGIASNGDRIDVAFDVTGQLFWARRNGGNWNGTVGADPATGTGGISFSGLGAVAMFAAGTVSTGTVVTANFGATAFSGTVPSGYTALGGSALNAAGLLFGG